MTSSTDTNASAFKVVEDGLKDEAAYKETKDYYRSCILYLEKGDLFWGDGYTYAFTFADSLRKNKIFSKETIAEATASFKIIDTGWIFSNSYGEYINPITKKPVRVEKFHTEGLQWL